MLRTITHLVPVTTYLSDLLSFPSQGDRWPHPHVWFILNWSPKLPQPQFGLPALSPGLLDTQHNPLMYVRPFILPAPVPVAH